MVLAINKQINIIKLIIFNREKLFKDFISSNSYFDFFSNINNNAILSEETRFRYIQTEFFIWSEII